MIRSVACMVLRLRNYGLHAYSDCAQLRIVRQTLVEREIQ